MTEAQIVTAFEAVLGFPPRAADVAVLGDDPTPAALAEYVWDHWLGEPETPSPEDVEAAIAEALS